MPLPAEATKTPHDPGRDAVAARIRALAQAHGMSLPRDGELSALLAAIQVGDPIPLAAFAVVADILYAPLLANQRHATYRGEAS